jgi:uncharacterized protein (TIGR01777 family)
MYPTGEAPMKILITGGTGFIGPHLVARLVQDGHEVTILIRPSEEKARVSPGASFLEGDPTQKGIWQEAIRKQDTVINLAGASIFSRWTDQQKKEIRESRISTTRNIVEAIEANQEKSFTLFSTSAVGYYGFHGDEELSEDSTAGDDFLATLAVAWEEEAFKAREKGARVVVTRFGIVLGPGGGALGQMLPVFKRFAGGPIGNGRQWFSWVHMSDLTEGFVFLFGHPELSGPVNLCSPNPVRNKELAQALGKALRRPSFLPAPAFMIKLVFGEFGSVILKGQRVVPRRLLENGFVFRYPEIDKAIENVVQH